MKNVFTLFAILVFAVFSAQAQNPFGNGSDGALTVIEGETLTINTERTTVTGYNPAGSFTIHVDSTGGITVGDEVIIIIMQDADMEDNSVGLWEIHYVSGVGGGILNLESPLEQSFSSSGEKVIQVVKIPNYTSVNIYGTLNCPSWNGHTGGILAFRSNDAVLVAETALVDNSGKGYQGVDRQPDNQNGKQGEGILGIGVQSTQPYGNAGGGGQHAYGGGGGGGHAFEGETGNSSSSPAGIGGTAVGDETLTKLFMGGSGGTGGDNDSNNGANPNSGSGGGILLLTGNVLQNSGSIATDGSNANATGGGNDGGSGGGAGGSLVLEFYSIQNESIISAHGGEGYNSSYPGGDGSVGRTRLNYSTFNNTGTVSPDPYLAQYVNIVHAPLSNTSDVSGPYNIELLAYDNDGDPITGASIFYRVNGGSFSEVSMTSSKDLEGFSGSIPGQAVNTTIDYYLTATDGSDTYTLPVSAPADLFSFEITGFPPYGLQPTDNNDGTVSLNWIEPLDLTNFVDYTLYRSEQENFTPGAFNLLAENIADTSFLDNTVVDFHTYYYVVSANYNFSGTANEAFSSHTDGLLVNNTSQTTILGYAYLEDRNNHANIKVRFEPQSPSAVLDSVYTNALGYFETHDLFPGVYNIRFYKDGFQTPLIHENLSIVEDTDLGESMLYDMGTEVSGDVSGTWSEFISVSGDITVPVGDSLIIEAGTIVRFLGKYHFLVYGYLASNGALGDSVLITSGPANQAQARDQWHGIDFYGDSDDNSYLQYTIVEYAYDGIYYEWSEPAFYNCKIREHARNGVYANRSDNSEIIMTQISDCSTRGVYTEYSELLIDQCEFMNFGSQGCLFDNESNATITVSSFTNCNTGINARHSSDVLIEDCEFTNNGSQGIYTDDMYQRGKIFNNTFTSNGNGIFVYYRSHPVISGNTFYQNGDGIEIYYNSNPVITENDFINNNNGVHINSSSHYCTIDISRNLFVYNTNDGIHKDTYSSSYWNTLTAVDNTIFGNGGDGIQIREIGDDLIRNNIISGNGNYGIHAQGVVETFENNDVYDNAAGDISDLNNLPAETWNFVSFNPNNSADCDIYRNINEDPMFSFADTLDFSLSLGSKCIDGGSESLNDPDGSISDIGVMSFDHGNPHMIEVTAFGNQSVSLAWDAVENDSIVEYNVYYMVAGAEDDYTLFGSTAGTSEDVTGLTNNVLYDFTVTGVYPNYESIYAPKVSERPGVPQLEFDPLSYSLIIPAAEDSIVEDMTLTNSGSRDLEVSFPFLHTGLDYAYFDGSGDYLNYGHYSHLEGMDELTLECWLYRQNNGHFEFLGKNYRNYQFAINDQEKVHFYKGYGNPVSDNYQSWNTGYYINANEWYHLAITWEGENVKLFVNGELVWEENNAVSSPIARQGYAFNIGRRGGENSYYMNGRLAEARVWGVARTQDEVREYMNRSLMGDEDGLLGYWPLQDDFDDHSTYGLTATVNGNTVLEEGSLSEWAYYSVPEPMYTITAGNSEIVPLTFYNRTDLTSKFFTSVLYSDDPAKEKNDLEVFLQYGETVPATPVHFIPVPETGKPYTLVIKDATIDGVTIDIGDEIGVFDGELCVGAGIFDGTFNFAFTAWEADGGMDGFTAGNPMVFKMYDTSADLETNEADETYFIGNDTFAYGAFSALSLEASVYNYQNVAVTGGQFNLVSFNLLPHYPDAWDVFGGLEGLQIVYNDDGNVLIPGYNINTIGDINFVDGFYLFGDDNTTIQFEGTYIHEEDWDITVEPAKWNYISVLSQDPLPVVDVFAGLEDEVSIVQEASGDSWIPAQGINTIGNMQPGLGYKIALAVDTAITFNYPASSKKSGMIPEIQPAKQAAPTDDTHFVCIETGLPYAVVMSIKSPKESPYNLVAGDEIALFDGNICVGSAVYDGSDQLLLTAWEEDASLELPGFTPGHLMQVLVYREALATTVKYNVVTRSGKIPHYGEGNYANVVLEIGPISEAPFKFDVLPNPFKEQTEIVLNLQKEDVVKIDIFDNSGRLVKSLANKQYTASQHQISWNGTDMTGKKLDPGIYFVIAETTESVYTEKVIILK